MVRKTLLVGAMLAVATGAVVAAPVAAAAPLPGCSASYTPFDPDEGAGEGWSKCDAMEPGRQRVKLTCLAPDGTYTAYGDWVEPARFYSTTTCYGGHRATGVTYEKG